MSDPIQANIYDFPQYYDLVYGSDWKAELEFLRGCFQKHVMAPVRQVFEPACGTGRLLFRLAKAGFQVSGIDLNPHAVRYCNDRLRRRGYPPAAAVGDMRDFRIPREVDAAFNMINSFRHLRSESDAQDHLRCTAAALRRGGIYVLGLHLTPTAGEPTLEESWSARRGHLCVNTRLVTVHRDLDHRQEHLKMTHDVYMPTRQFRIEDTLVFRTYTAQQMKRLLESFTAFELLETYDFTYDIDRPIRIDRETEDSVFVLRKRF